MPKNLIIAALASIIVAAVCVTIVLTQRDDVRPSDWPWRYDGPAIEGWPWRDDDAGPTLIVCPGDNIFEGSYVSNEWGCDQLAELRAERDQLRTALQRTEGERDLFMDLYLALPLTSCLEQQRRYDAKYWASGAPPKAGGHHENLLRRECGDAEAARFIEATTRERPDWAKE